MPTRTFGGKWHDKTFFEVLWYNKEAVYINRPLASRTITIMRDDAVQLRDALNDFLAHCDENRDEK
jgi:hypothetical protein